MIEPKDEKLWQLVNKERVQFMEGNFGVLPKDILKMVHLKGIWPGGGLYQIHTPQLGDGLSVFTTFGLSNPDMPTSVTLANKEQRKGEGNAFHTKTTLVKKENIPEYPGRAGYGYELMMIANPSADWPLWFLQWAVEAEILNDANLLGMVEKYDGLTVQEITVGEGEVINVLIHKAIDPLPSQMVFSNGRADLLVATLITEDEMRWSMEFGRGALLELLQNNRVGQISDIRRKSICHLPPLPVINHEKEDGEKVMRQYLSFISPFIDEILDKGFSVSYKDEEMTFLEKSMSYTLGAMEYNLRTSEKSQLLAMMLKIHLILNNRKDTLRYFTILLKRGDLMYLNEIFQQFQSAKNEAPFFLDYVHGRLFSGDVHVSLFRVLHILYKVNYHAILIETVQKVESLAIQADMEAYVTWYSMGVVYAYKKAYESAIACYERAADAQSPDDEHYNLDQEMFHGSIAEAYLQLEKFEAALGAAEKALTFIPDSHSTISVKVEALLKMNEREKATNFVYDMISVYPGLSGLEQMLP